MVHDKALEAMKTKDRVFERDELDARNSEDRPETYEATVAKLYNDPDIEFYTEAMPALHEFYEESLYLDFNIMPGGEISAEDVKKKIGDAHAKLMQVSNKCLVQWLNIKRMIANGITLCTALL